MLSGVRRSIEALGPALRPRAATLAGDAPAIGRDASAWRRFVLGFLAVVFAILAAALAAVVLIDPYDTGYFPSLIGPGAVDDDDRTGAASRGRDPRFDAAIFGNSHALLLSPPRLSAATGLSFVQLTTLGAGAHDQMTLIRYFLRRHANPRAIVIAADSAWCTHDLALPGPANENPVYAFPDWLFGESRLVYLANMLSGRPMFLLRRRILLGLGRVAPVDPEGHSDYPPAWDFGYRNRHLPDHVGVPLSATVTVDPQFPAVDRFAELLATTSDRVAVVVVMPPLFYRMLPSAGTKEAAELALCKQRLAGVVGRRSHAAFIDFLVDSPLSRERSNFMDPDHMAASAARAIEQRIAAALDAPR